MGSGQESALQPDPRLNRDKGTEVDGEKEDQSFRRMVGLQGQEAEVVLSRKMGAHWAQLICQPPSAAGRLAD